MTNPDEVKMCLLSRWGEQQRKGIDVQIYENSFGGWLTSNLAAALGG